MSKHEFLGNLN